MNTNSAFMIPQQVMARKVGAETVILDLASGTYFGLDPIGARIWQLIGEGRSLAHVCDVLMEEYEVAREELERDALVLAHELVDKKLISAR